MPTLAYRPALDGLRAVCLLAVLLYHAGLDGASGGFLGVSTFFTLSGFLITTLLLDDARLGLFWSRRLRRLLPASLATLAVIGATGWLWLRADRLATLGSDLLASLFYVVNWRLVHEDYAYSLIFSDPTPVQHFWSLAIEGQFYLVFPLAVAGARAAGGRRAVAAMVVTGAAVSTALCVVLGLTPALRDRVYFGSDTRAAELLVGAIVALAGHRLGRLPAGLRDAVGGLALAGLVACFALVELEMPALYRGGLPAFGVLSALVVVGCLADGWLARGLALPPLVALGRISYGAYLFHWPIYQALDWQALPTPLPVLVPIALTLVLAAASYHGFEAPVRRGRWLAPPRFAWTAGAAAAALVAAVAIGQPAALRPAATDPKPPLDAFLDRMRDHVTTVAFVGDSTSLRLREGFAPWAASRPDVWLGPGISVIGCGLLNAYVVERQLAEQGTGSTANRAERCGDFLSTLEAQVRRFRPDLLVVAVGVWEIRGVELDTPGRLAMLPEPAVVRALQEALERLSAIAAAADSEVVWLTTPRIDPPRHWALSPARTEANRRALLSVVKEHARHHPKRFHIVDLGLYAETFGDGPFDPALRPDGVHYLPSAAERLTEEWLGEAVLKAHEDV